METQKLKGFRRSCPTTMTAAPVSNNLGFWLYETDHLFLAEYLHLSHNESVEGSDIKEDRELPSTFLDDSNASVIALQLAPDTPNLRMVIRNLLQGDLSLEIPDDMCTAFNATPDGPNYTCSLFRGNRQRCAIRFIRLDRFKHHLQDHIGITPYSCMSSPTPTVEPKW
jgi:hypothetical protein